MPLMIVSEIKAATRLTQTRATKLHIFRILSVPKFFQMASRKPAVSEIIKASLCDLPGNYGITTAVLCPSDTVSVLICKIGVAIYSLVTMAGNWGRVTLTAGALDWLKAECPTRHCRQLRADI